MKWLIVIALIIGAALAAVTALKKYRKQMQEEALLAEKMRQEEALIRERNRKEAARQREIDRIHKEVEARTQQFKDEIEAIPQADITLSQPASRQYLKDMPEYSFSNVTAKTKLSAIFPLVVLDVETTGFLPASDEIIEVSAIKFDVGMIPTACFTTLCKPKKPIPYAATAVNHITDDMVEAAPSFRQVAPALSEFIAGCNLAGHNLEFDLRFLYVNGVELPFNKKLFDTLEIAQHTIRKSDIDNHKLESLCSWYGVYRSDAHRSLSDSYATAKIFNYLVFDRTSRDLSTETGEQ